MIIQIQIKDIPRGMKPRGPENYISPGSPGHRILVTQEFYFNGGTGLRVSGLITTGMHTCIDRNMQ